ncbi:MAG TPA: anti-sigma factor [Opitutaceae bacterium]|nr:anti-sigma factor [Opitutaceae bacterium]
MTCEEFRPLLEVYVDGELDAAHTLQIEKHAEACPTCGERIRVLQQRRDALAHFLPRYTAPAVVESRIREQRLAMPRANAAGESVDGFPAKALKVRQKEGGKRRMLRWVNFSLAAAAAVLVAFGGGARWGAARQRSEHLVREARETHLRALSTSHLMDVVSTDQHTVKPWFAGKLDFSPPVVDLAASGFPLTGGRVDRIDARPAAALVYQRRQHVINLLIWPTREGAIGQIEKSIEGYQVECWSRGGYNFAAISDLGAKELGEFSSEISKEIAK